MSINKTWNGVVYSIPNTRSESGWETTLSSYLQALADNAATTTFNKQAVRKATTTPVTVSASTDCTIIVDLTGPGASTVNLPAGADKQIFIIVDGKGDASTNNITIDANGSETIEGSLTKVIRLNRECLVLQYSSSAGDWKVIGGYVPNMVGGPASSTDNAIARFDGTTGKLVQNSGASLDDSNNMSAASYTATGGTAANNTMYVASNVLRFRGGTSGLGFNNSSGTEVASVTDAGAWTLGPSGNRSFNSGVVTGIYKNCYVTGSHGRDNRITSSNTGAAIEVQEALTNASPCIAFYVNKDDDSTSTPASLVGEVYPSGAWTFGLSGADSVDHTLRGTTKLYRANATATSYLFYAHSNVGGTDLLKWRVECDGDTISSTGSYTSDLRAKKDVAPIHYGLNEILQLDPMSFRWNHDGANETKSFSLGSAQLIQSIMPEMVRDDGLEHVDSEGNKFQAKSIYGQEVVAVMVKAIQEQQSIIDGLKARIEALENK
jgi:hypothetical protein